MLTRFHYDLILAVTTMQGHSVPLVTPDVIRQLAREFDLDLGLNDGDIEEFAACMTIDRDTDFSAFVPIVWPSQPAPTTFPQLTLRWPTEYMKVSGMAAKISYDDIKENLEYAMHLAVHETLGLGGMLEHNRRQLIPIDDPTMQLFFGAIAEALLVAHPNWFDAEGNLLAVLPAGVPDRSDEQLEYDAAAQLRRHRRETAAKSAAARKAKQIAEAQAKRATFFAACDGRDTLLNAVMELANQMSLMEFDRAKAEGTLITSGTDTRCGPTWVPELIVRLCNDGLQDDQAVHFLEDYVLSKVRARLPNWFKETEDGSIRFRRAPQVDKPKGLDRPTRTLRKLLAKLIEKNGEDAVRANLDGITGR